MFGSKVEMAEPGVQWIGHQPSLNEARENFRRFGAATRSSLGRVRTPLPAEIGLGSKP